jgi:mRNA interferase MazF
MPPVVLRRGEVWMFDCGFAEKVRPVLVLSVPPGPQDRVLVTVVPHTTALRGSEFEVAVPVRFLKPGAFLVQGISTYPAVRAERLLGTMSAESLGIVEAGVRRWLGFR